MQPFFANVSNGHRIKFIQTLEPLIAVKFCHSCAQRKRDGSRSLHAGFCMDRWIFKKIFHINWLWYFFWLHKKCEKSFVAKNTNSICANYTEDIKTKQWNWPVVTLSNASVRTVLKPPEKYKRWHSALSGSWYFIWRA